MSSEERKLTLKERIDFAKPKNKPPSKVKVEKKDVKKPRKKKSSLIFKIIVNIAYVVILAVFLFILSGLMMYIVLKWLKFMDRYQFGSSRTIESDIGRDPSEQFLKDKERFETEARMIGDDYQIMDIKKFVTNLHNEIGNYSMKMSQVQIFGMVHTAMKLFLAEEMSEDQILQDIRRIILSRKIYEL